MEIRAFDVHVHPPSQTTDQWKGEAKRDMFKYFGADSTVEPTVDELAEKYRSMGIFANLLGGDDSSARGTPPIGNDYLAGIVRQYPDVFCAFGAVDPWKGKVALREIERCSSELGLVGIKFHPNAQEFFLNDQRFYPLYALMEKLGLLMMVHTGMSGAGAGSPGGRGFKLKYSAPIPYIDDVAADFPGLTIIMAHPSWPWQEEQLAVVSHKGNVYMDLSGWSPKYFQPSLIQYANSRIQDKVMFGSDFPMIQPERWLKDFAQAPFKDELRSKILLENARKLFKLSQ